MENDIYNLSLKRDKKLVNCDLEIYSWFEADVFYYYGPALEMVGYGNTMNEAEKSFDYMLNDLTKNSSGNENLLKELVRLGWTKHVNQSLVVQPTTDYLLKNNEDFKYLLSRTNIELSKFNRTVNFFL
ncbi:hypothetical protein [Sphingobacterium hungaricum]|uniref:Uncharacterized protein n=1 Tax=Sphingobacterium hungaricum TaxID=2082723 RepID=A0A928UYT3_9SPHI|nr:hypothetical protein [Sphingobacterium hungaricum]MBE8713297.1 hypothetical protein [Sphingobacterium hungaricum]